MSTPFNEWDFTSKRLGEDVQGNDFITSESVAILVTKTPKITDQSTLDTAELVAITQDIGFSQQRQFIQVFEIGSNQKYTLSSGRTQGGINMSRVLFDGESLLSLLSPGERDIRGESNFRDKAGYEKFFMNLASSVFSKPVGIAMIFSDLARQNVGGIFFEEVFVNSHQLSVSANSAMIGESVSMIYNAIVPLQVSRDANTITLP